MAAPERAGCTPVPDEELIERIAGGDEEAFEQLYDRYLPRVFRFVQRRLRDRADTEETVQEVFLNIFSSLASFRGDAPFAAWVLGLTRRTVASRFKKRRHLTIPLEGQEEPGRLDPAMPAVRREPTPLENYECHERIARMQDAANHHLSEEQWNLFELYHLQRHSIQEIALALNKSEDAIKSNLYRARKRLLAR